jgi:hypothetical protein
MLLNATFGVEKKMFLPHAANYAYSWLVANNLWKSTVAFFVACILGWTVGHRPWKKHREAQTHMEDMLNTDTPGGLQVIKSLLLELNDGEEEDDESEDADDNGSDLPMTARKRKRKLRPHSPEHDSRSDDVRTGSALFTRIGSMRGGGK